MGIELLHVSSDLHPKTLAAMYWNFSTPHQIRDDILDINTYPHRNLHKSACKICGEKLYFLLWNYIFGSVKVFPVFIRRVSNDDDGALIATFDAADLLMKLLDAVEGRTTVGPVHQHEGLTVTNILLESSWRIASLWTMKLSVRVPRRGAKCWPVLWKLSFQHLYRLILPLCTVF